MGKIIGTIIKWFFYLVGFCTIIVLLVVALLGNSVRVEQRVEQQSANPVTQNYVPIQPAPVVSEPESIVYTDFGQLGEFYRNIDEEVVGYHQQGAVMQYTCKPGEIGVYLSIDKANTVMGEANDDEVVAYIPCPTNGSAISATTIHWSGDFQRAHWVVVEKELPMTPLEALMLLKAEEQNREALFFNADGTFNSY